jgi:YHS domain-containing protein
MWRLIVLTVVLVLAYFLVRRALRGLFDKKKDLARSGGSSGTPAEMVQDPVCGLYVPRDGALFFQQGGQTHFFCSETCRAGYEKTLTGA